MTASNEIQTDLRRIIEGDIFFDEAHKKRYSAGASIYRINPLGVVIPRSREDVVNVVKYAQSSGISLIARGAGSSLAGQAVGEGLILDFRKYMGSILETNLEERWVKVEPGLVHGKLNQHLAQYGKQFQPDPSSAGFCTIGGVVANNSSGAHALKYGHTIDHVISLDVVLANGDEITTAEYKIDSDEYRRLEASGSLEGVVHRRVRKLVEDNADLIERKQPKVKKNSCGYRLERVIEGGTINLSKIITGSEGTLAIIVAAKLGIVDLPKLNALGLIHFSSVEAAGEAIREILKLNPAALEMMDKNSLDIVRERKPELRRFLPEGLDTQLLVDFEGETKAELDEKMDELRDRICDASDIGLALGMEAAFDSHEQEALWAVRRATLPILRQMAAKRESSVRITHFIDDVAVPPERIPEYIRSLKNILEKHDIRFAIFGHAGHGHLHTLTLLNPGSDEGKLKMRAVAEEVAELAVNLGGTISGEHGDGLARSQFIETVYGELVEAFREAKNIFDPLNILNPDKKVCDGELLTKNLKFSRCMKI